jgi:thiamine pyrophosphokinase
VKTSILDTLEPLTIIGGGDCTVDDIALARTIAPTCVAADGGAHIALSTGVTLAAVIGDMDTISKEARAQIPDENFHQIAEQDSTDFDKVLRHISTPLAVAVGFSGGQVDHALAALHTLAVYSHKRVVLLGERDIVFLCPPHMDLPLEADTRVSLFPLGPVRGTSTGLHWPIDGIDFAPGYRSGTSNKATGDITVTVESPNMLCILPRRFIRQVASSLAGPDAPAQWPVRAR